MELLCKLLVPLVCCLSISCVSQPQLHVPNKTPNQPKSLLVFMDGTANDEGSYTNVSSLRNLVTLQDKASIQTAYIKGVGTAGLKILGMAFGTGFAKDIKQAYEFLTVRYKKPQDKIYLFGFSRGAYGARVLAGLVQAAGIPDLSAMTVKQRSTTIDKIFRAYKSKSNLKDKIFEVNKVMPRGIEDFRNGKTVEIEFVGVWDTVEALATPDGSIKPFVSNPDYIDQLCNVKRVAHALSLDDDRARIFTPILLTEFEAKEQCGDNILLKREIDQVFFSGAHADVGGGYDGTTISGVSLNWMLSKIKHDELVPKGTSVYADPYDITHDPESAEWKFLYRFLHRDVSAYDAILDHNLTVHQTVIDRLNCVPRRCNEVQWLDQENTFKHCFTRTDKGLLQYAPDNTPYKCHLRLSTDGYKYKECPTTEVISGKIIGQVDIYPCINGVNTKIILEKGSNYMVSLSGVNGWEDDGTCATPETGRRISRSDSPLLTKGLMYLGKLFSYKFSSGYMELLGEVNGQRLKLGRMARNKTVFSPKKSGELIVRVNEPRFNNKYYANNRGQLTLVVTKVR